jgi:nitroreductase
MAQRNRREFLVSGLTLGTWALLNNSCVAQETKEKQGQKMSLFDVINKRRSVRKFKSDPIPKEHIEKILDAARMAPTAGNQQPWKFLVIQDRKKLEALKLACVDNSLEGFKSRGTPTQEQIADRKKKSEEYYNNILSAPVYIVVLTDTKSKYPDYNHHDGPLAAGYLMLAARALGYGTVYFTDSIPNEVTQKVFQIPERYKRVCITPVGIPHEWPETPEKKPLKDLAVYEAF